jgi:hypothetical protein
MIGYVLLLVYALALIAAVAALVRAHRRDKPVYDLLDQLTRAGEELLKRERELFGEPWSLEKDAREGKI